MDRRAFIKLTAVSGAGAGLAACGNPEHQLIRFVPEEELVPGVAEWRPSVCPLCASGCGVRVRVMEADVEVERAGQIGVVRQGVAKKLEGNPDHPISRGGLCARGQASIQVTYHPDRLTGPMRRVGPRGEGRFEAVSWDVALADVVGRLNALAESGAPDRLAWVTGAIASGRRELIGEFARAYGASAPVVHELFGDDVLRHANALSFGCSQLPTFDLARTNYLLNFGADVLGTWNAPVAHTAAYAEMRQGRPGVRGRMVQLEARMSQTGTCADEWLPVAPGTEGILALGLAHVVMRDRRRRSEDAGAAGRLIDGWERGLPDQTPAAVAQLTGLSVAQIERLSREIVELAPALVIIGGAPLAHSNGLASALAVNALNALLGAVETPGGEFFTPSFVAAGPAEGRAGRGPVFREWVGALLSGDRRVGVLFLDGANPVYSSPTAWRVREALDKVPFVVSFGCFVDETSAQADLLLPDHSALESWVSALPESGTLMAVASVAPPAMRPIHLTRAVPDVLLEIGRTLQRPLALPWSNFEEFLKARFEATESREPEAWGAATQRGGWWRTSAPASRVAANGARAPRRGSNAADATGTLPAIRMPEFSGDAATYPFHFLPYPSIAFHDGSVAHLPWLQEMPDPMTSALWSSWVEINPMTAARLGVGPGDTIEIASPHGSIRSAAVISPGIAPNVVAMPVGQGHTMFTRYASGRGENPVAILSPVVEPQTGALAWAATRVRLTRVGGPDGRLILFAGESREQPAEGGVR
jgi:anaerobic selenocysteine-containing dehydrogenase